MVLWLMMELREYFPPLRVFRYVSFRVIASMLTGLAISFILHPWFIRRLQSRQIGQVVDCHFAEFVCHTIAGNPDLVTVA